MSLSNIYIYCVCYAEEQEKKTEKNTKSFAYIQLLSQLPEIVSSQP